MGTLVRNGCFLLVCLAAVGCSGGILKSDARRHAAGADWRGLVAVEPFSIKTDMRGDVRVWGSSGRRPKEAEGDRLA